MEENSYTYLPLFETKPSKGRIPFRLHSLSIFISICIIFIYRITRFPSSEEQFKTWVWLGLFLSELWFTLYWFLTVLIRWNPIFRHTFKDRLSPRYEMVFPGVDIFVCTADPVIEPPCMVINTVLSVMAYDYPPEKLSVYLSDDGGSELMFYAMVEASRFAKKWLPFCRKFGVEPRSPEAYFRGDVEEDDDDTVMENEWREMKNLYEEMKDRIEKTTKLGRVSEDVRKEHKGFREWGFVSSPRDHQAILQILIDGRDPKAVDMEGKALPNLVYLAREKRPKYHHNFKAGAMNALIRVSSKISNGPIILNVDCDMYSNNCESVRDALCFFMDEEQSHDIAYVQYAQNMNNITENDIYSNSLIVIYEGKVELPGMDWNGGPCYIGSGCFHRRDALSRKKYIPGSMADWERVTKEYNKIEETANVLEGTCKILASCAYEEDTLWGKEMGLKYGCPAEDVITGLSIHCRGWRSIFYNPERRGFKGVAPTTLLQSLVQHKRWGEGNLQIFLSKYCPVLYGYGKIPLKLRFAYCTYSLWAANCLATLYYVFVPSLCLIRGVSLFPKISSKWVLPFAYAIISNCTYSLGEFLWVGGTHKGWWNDQRMWLFKRTTSYFFGFTDTILKLLGFTKSAFVITTKVTEEDVSQRYEQEVMEYGAASPMFTILATLALLNLFSLVGGLKRAIWDLNNQGLDQFAMQILLSGVLVLLNLPVYQGLFFRNDNGRIPTTITYRSIIYALLAWATAAY